MMDSVLLAQNNAVTAYKETNGRLRLVSFGGCGEAYKRAFKRKWNKLMKADKCQCGLCELTNRIEALIEQKKSEARNIKKAE